MCILYLPIVDFTQAFLITSISTGIRISNAVLARRYDRKLALIIYKNILAEILPICTRIFTYLL